MNLLLSIVIYVVVGCGEWYLALRRTLACARGEKVLLVSIVFIENLLGLWVLSNFIRTNNWALALSYSAGASAGALIVAMNGQYSTAETSKSLTSRRRRHSRNLAIAQNERLLFDLAETPEDAEPPGALRAAWDSLHHATVKSPRPAEKAARGSARERWRHYLSFRSQNPHRVQCSG